ncbi:TetR/AcrR family transcriptional regulator [Undibacterium sp. TJN19]|uniref:TetR/AcrR family transcriptional regulator n=1 Tax=Undibacterium sp. TJN19 TaxID=3413055 RepID=UPI003BF2A8D4
MRNSREQTAQTRERIVETAARLYRERGINGIGVADLMSEAGLTHGGFYKHFESKEALIAEACTEALQATRAELRRKVDQANDADALAALVHSYLSKVHSDHPGHGCAIAAMGAEAIRDDGLGKVAMAEGVDELLALIRQQLTRKGSDDVDAKAHGILAALIGGLLLSRTMSSGNKAKAVLRDTSAFILKAI